MKCFYGSGNPGDCGDRETIFKRIIAYAYFVFVGGG